MSAACRAWFEWLGRRPYGDVLDQDGSFTLVVDELNQPVAGVRQSGSTRGVALIEEPNRFLW